MNRNKVLIGVFIGILLITSFSYGLYRYSFDQENEIFISTTTSVDNTGLLEYLIQEFESSHNYHVKYTAVGSGAAIQLARDGEVDAVLVHAPPLEQQLIDDGFSDKRNTLWYNYFTIVGPPSDPAEIQSTTSVVQAFRKIYEAGENGIATFYSRGDHSGTHLKEEEIWNQTQYQVDPESDWYFETGTGMASTLSTTDNDPNGYTLTDLGTYATLQESETPLDKKSFSSKDELLYNPYSYLVINSEVTGTDLNTEGAKVFLDFLTAPTTDTLVNNYTVNDIVLFTPIANEE